MKKLTYLSFVLVALVTACAKKNVDGVGISNGNTAGPIDGAFLAMQADLTGATAITSNVIVGKDEKRHLLKVSADGKITVVLTGEHELLSFKLTPNFIVARVSIVEQGGSCSLIAIPRINGVTRVRCLNRRIIACLSGSGTNGGYDVVGDEVFFAYQQPVAKHQSSHCVEASVFENDAAISELRKWDGKSETVQTLFHSDVATVQNVQPVVRDVFTSTTGNVCIEAGYGGLMCRDAKLGSWTRPHAEKFWRTLASYHVKQGDTLLGYTGFPNYKLNLNTFEVADRNGIMPTRIDFRSPNGRIMGTNEGHLYCIDPKGDSESILQNLTRGARPARLGNHAWYFGPDQLRRVEIDTCKLDAQNYFGGTKLLSLTSLSWSLGDFLRLDGIGAAGLPSTSLIDADGRLVTNQTVSIPVEHPIELSWK